MTTQTARIAAWVSDANLNVPREIRDRAKAAILDVVGATIGARRSPDFALTDLLAPAAAGSTLLAQAGSHDPARSAFVNSYHAHLLDFDDSSGDLAGHPSAIVLPAALAVAASSGISGARLLDAYCVGVEVACRVGRIVNPGHYDVGWHPTATLGIFGATAAAARLLGLSAETTGHALGLAAAFSNGIKASFGTTAKPLQVARAAESGVLAAQLAQAGASANGAVFEHSQGFRRVFDRADPAVDAPFSPPVRVEDWSIATPGIIIKQFPCCGSTHSAVEAARELWPLDADDIERVIIAVHPRRRGHVDRPDPRDALEAKFSLQYTVARMLLSGAVTIDDFTAERFDAPSSRQVMAACTAIDLADVSDDRFEDRYGARVEVELRDGSRLEAFVPVAEGRSPGQMLPTPRVRAKFAGCVAPFLDPAAVDALADLILGLEDVPDAATRILQLSQPR